MHMIASKHLVTSSSNSWSHAMACSIIIFIVLLVITVGLICLTDYLYNHRHEIQSKIQVNNVFPVATVSFCIMLCSFLMLLYNNQHDINFAHVSSPYTLAITHDEKYQHIGKMKADNKYSYFSLPKTYQIIYNCRNHILPAEAFYLHSGNHIKQINDFHSRARINSHNIYKQLHFIKLNNKFLTKRHFTKPNVFNYF